MDDRGEKIITLAREMLRAEPILEQQPSETRPSLSFKAMCFATILAATSSSLLTSWAHEARRPINRYERTELNALVFYAARLKGIEETSLRSEIEKQLGTNFDDLTRRDFKIARLILQEKAH